MFAALRDLIRPSLSAERKTAMSLHAAVVTAARQPVLYAKGGIPDTPEGRLESIALHAFLLFRRMSGRTGWDGVGGALSDEIVADLDRSLREMGVGDMSIGKKVKKLARTFFGRFDAFWGAVNGADGADDIQGALRKSVYLDADNIDQARLDAMVSYFDGQSVHLFNVSESDVLGGRVKFADAGPWFLHLPDMPGPEE